MFFAHLPAGYLVSRALLHRCPVVNPKWVLAAGMIGGAWPDIDLLYLYLLDATPQHHHTYWTHLPIAWLGISLWAWIASRERSPAFRLPLAAFLLGWASHLLLDSVTGDIWWLYPLVDQPYSLAHVEAIYQPWWINFLLHWSMAIELAIIAVALGVEAKNPLVFKALARPGIGVLASILVATLLLAEAYLPAPALQQPVQGASQRDWHPDSYWHPHWGASGVHKGIDIFAQSGTAVTAAQSGLVLYRGTLKQGGNVILTLSPRGWLHYYAHLGSAQARPGTWLAMGAPIGQVGTSGNAKGKPPHLHYSILSFVPKLTEYRPGQQGWKRVFYRNPGKLIRQL
ncbi:MAG: peptidoglycan DD-metalloendopeptidase family protein [Thiobacillus sp.]|nr:peptidoglycan DD-metalloendopeptidase family protein [Thiobacillus sp.]